MPLIDQVIRPVSILTDLESEKGSQFSHSTVYFSLTSHPL